MVRIVDESRKYFRFIFYGKLYQFTSLSFGFWHSPLIFTKIIKPVISYLRSTGYRSNVYLDDFLLYGNSYEDCIRHQINTIELLLRLGFIINYEKSNLIPSTRCKYLGFIIDSHNFTIELTEKRKQNILKKLKSFKPNKSYKIREYSQLQGLLVSAFPGVEYSMMYTKNFEMDKTKALYKNKNNYESKMIISKNTIDYLK